MIHASRTKTFNSYLEMSNGLQSAFRPFEPLANTNNIKNIICQSISSLSFEFYDPRDEADSDFQGQIMTNQTEFSRATIRLHLTCTNFSCISFVTNKTHHFRNFLNFCTDFFESWPISVELFPFFEFIIRSR